MKIVVVVAGLWCLLSIYSCKKCGHCVYDNGTTDQKYCNSGSNYDPSTYRTYQALCESETGAKWVVDK